MINEDLIKVLIASMVPVGELRLSIPLGVIVLDLPIFSVFLFSVIGNSIPVIILIPVIQKVARFAEGLPRPLSTIFIWRVDRLSRTNGQLFNNECVIGSDTGNVWGDGCIDDTQTAYLEIPIHIEEDSEFTVSFTVQDDDNYESNEVVAQVFAIAKYPFSHAGNNFTAIAGDQVSLIGYLSQDNIKRLLK